ncbi:unnamed protein product [Discosporangium mesarthrocarpum]
MEPGRGTIRSVSLHIRCSALFAEERLKLKRYLLVEVLLIIVADHEEDHVRREDLEGAAGMTGNAGGVGYCLGSDDKPRQLQGWDAERRYSELLQSRPLLTKAVTSGVIAGAGDITCQVVVTYLAAKREGESEIYREGRPTLSESSVEEGDDVKDGTVGNGNRDGGGGELVVKDNQSESSLADESFFDPLRQVEVDWSRCARFSFLGAALVGPALHHWYALLEKRVPGTLTPAVARRLALDQFIFSPIFMVVFFSSVMFLDGKTAKIPDKLRHDFWPTLVSNWGYWMPAQVVNFKLVPHMYQVLFANVLGYFWNVFLSFQSFKAMEGEAARRGGRTDRVREDASDKDHRGRG